jgi:four helix bundle protein
MTQKEEFIIMMKSRTKQFALNIIKLCRSLETSQESKIISHQLIKSATSTGANYRAACKARSGAEYFSKLCIAVEESDESEYWLELIRGLNEKRELEMLIDLQVEANEITRILTKSKFTHYNNSKK